MTLLHWFILLLFIASLLVIWWQRYSFAEKLEHERKSSFISLCLEKERSGHCEVELAEANERIGDFTRNYVPKVRLTEALDLSSNLEQEIARLTGVCNLARESHSKAMEEVDNLRSSTVPLENFQAASSERDELRQRFEVLTVELQQTHAAETQVKNELQQIEQRLAERSASFTTSQAALAAAEQSLSSTRAALFSKEGELTNLAQKHQQVTDTLADLQQEHQQLFSTHEILQKDFAEHRLNTVAKSEFESIRESLTSLQIEHQALQTSTVPVVHFQSLQSSHDEKANALEAKHGELEQVRAELNAKASALDWKHNEHLAVVNELEQVRAELNAKASALDWKHNEHLAVVNELEQVRAELNAKASALDWKHNEHLAVVNELEQVRTELNAKASALDWKHNEHLAVVNELDSHKFSLTEKAAEIAAATIALNQAKEVFSSQEQALRSETEHLRHILTEKEKAFATAQSLAAADMKQHEMEANNARKELNQLQQKFAEKDHALTALQESSALLREQLESNRNNIRAELEEVKSTLAQREQALQVAQAQLADNGASLALVQKELAAREQAFANAKLELQLQQQTIASAKAEILEKDRAINEAQAATMEITRGFEAEVEAAQDEVLKLRNELKSLQASANEAQRERQRLAVDLDQHRTTSVSITEHQALRNSMAETVQRASHLDALVSSLHTQLAELQSSHVPLVHLQAATAEAEVSATKRVEAEHQKATAELRQQLNDAIAAQAAQRHATEVEIAHLRSECEQSRLALASAQSAATDATRWLLERLGVAPAGIIPSPNQQLVPLPVTPLGFTDATPNAGPTSTSLVGSPLLASEHDADWHGVLTTADRNDISEASHQLAPDAHKSQQSSPEEAALQAEIAAAEATQQDRHTYHSILAEQSEAALEEDSASYSPTSLLMDEEENEENDEQASTANQDEEPSPASTLQAKDRLAQLRDAITALAHSPIASVAGPSTLGLGASAIGFIGNEATAGVTATDSGNNEEASCSLLPISRPGTIEAQASNGRVHLYPIGVPHELASFEPDSVAWDGKKLLVAARCQRQSDEGPVTGVWSLSPDCQTISNEPSLALAPSKSSALAPLVVNGTGLWLGAAGDGVWHQSLGSTGSLRFSEAEGLPNARPNRAAIVSSQTFFAFAGKEGSKVVTFAPSAQRWISVQPSNGHVFGSVANLLNCGEWLAVVEHAGTVGRQSLRKEFLHLHRPRTGEWLLITPALKLRPGALMGATTSSKDGSALWLQIRNPAPGWDRLGRNARPIYTSQLVKLAIEPATGAASIAAIVPITLPDAYILLHHDGQLLWVATSKKINNPDDVTLYDAEVRAFDDTTLAARGGFTLPSQAGVGALASSPDMLWMKSFTQLPGNAAVPLYALHKAELTA